MTEEEFRAGTGTILPGEIIEVSGAYPLDMSPSFARYVGLSPDRGPSTDTAPDNLPDDNPKTRFGVAKPPFHLIPASALAHEACAFRDGARKYGPYNWREAPVSSSTYVGAALRHINAWFNGETNAQDSGVHHLAHARACLAILIDAAECDKLNDDRPPAFELQPLLDRLTTPIAP